MGVEFHHVFRMKHIDDIRERLVAHVIAPSQDCLVGCEREYQLAALYRQVGDAQKTGEVSPVFRRPEHFFVLG